MAGLEVALLLDEAIPALLSADSIEDEVPQNLHSCATCSSDLCFWVELMSAKDSWMKQSRLLQRIRRQRPHCSALACVQGHHQYLRPSRMLPDLGDQPPFGAVSLRSALAHFSWVPMAAAGQCAHNHHDKVFCRFFDLGALRRHCARPDRCRAQIGRRERRP